MFNLLNNITIRKFFSALKFLFQITHSIQLILHVKLSTFSANFLLENSSQQINKLSFPALLSTAAQQPTLLNKLLSTDQNGTDKEALQDA